MSALPGTRHEDASAVTYQYCPTGNTCMSKIVIYKTTPGSYLISPCATAIDVGNWDTLVASVDSLPNIVWTVV